MMRSKEICLIRLAVSAVEVGKQVTVKLMNGSKVKANVIKMGPMPVIFVCRFKLCFFILS